MTILALFVLVLVFVLLCWIVSLLPLPASPPALRNVLYILLAVLAIVVLLDLVGGIDIGLHRRLR